MHIEVLPCSIDNGPPKNYLSGSILFTAPNSILLLTPTTCFHQTHCSHPTLLTPPNLLCATHSIQSTQRIAPDPDLHRTDLLPTPLLHQTHSAQITIQLQPAHSTQLIPTLHLHISASRFPLLAIAVPFLPPCPCLALVHYAFGLQRVLFEASSILELKQRPSTASTGT